MERPSSGDDPVKLLNAEQARSHGTVCRGERLRAHGGALRVRAPPTAHDPSSRRKHGGGALSDPHADGQPVAADHG
jgi:hypothetical protein